MVKAIHIILAFALFLVGLNASSQERRDSFLILRTFAGDIANATIDNLDNLYIITSNGRIIQYNASGDSTGVYNQAANFGNLYGIDVSNPLKILLFYKDFATIVVLDRYLAVRATIDLKKYNILQPSAIGLAYDNNIWVYDTYDNKLKRIDEQGTTLLETPDFRNLFDLAPDPQRILSDNGLVYVADSAAGIFVFDNYGSFKKKIPVTNWQSLQVINNHIISTNKEVVMVYNPSTFMQSERKLPAFKPYLHAFTGNNKVITFSTTSLQVYQYKF